MRHCASPKARMTPNVLFSDSLLAVPLQSCDGAIQEFQRERNLLECVKSARDYKVALICNRFYGRNGDLNRKNSN